jgi:hypothetical protein
LFVGATQNFEQRRFARTIATNEANFVARHHGKRCAVDDELAADFNA